ncbi:hypothetical protein ABS71_02135 [bacterium SCN 62-11]|nr:MAG: hypothetical protein ABS71_02135 [bacterium SCN 62-11]
MEVLMRRLPGITWLKVDIGDADSSLAKEYKITQVPYLQIYGPEGQLLADGDEALRWIDDRLVGKPP